MRMIRGLDFAFGLALAASFAAGGTGCTKKFSCKALQAKFKTCSKEIAQAGVDKAVAEAKKQAAKLPEDQRKKKIKQARDMAKAGAGLIMAFAQSKDFVKKCEEGLKKKDKDTKKMKECFKKSSCKEFAACVISD